MQEATVDCPSCNVRISCKPRATVYEGDAVAQDAICLFQCPTCGTAIVGRAETSMDINGDIGFNHTERVYPSPARIQLNSAIPASARKDLQDAQKCHFSGIHSASAVLCGRAIERIVRDKTGEKTIAKGLQKLLDDRIIDEKLYSWADALRKERNSAAHATDDEITAENARDLLDFAIAIYEYVYVLHDKYIAFQARKNA
jgi:predicted RNA-binding Zn-ribbon protein involved in translation (DUF1610 family)